MPILLATSLGDAEQGDWLRLLEQALPQERFVTDRSSCDPADIDIAVVTGPLPGALQGLPALRFIQSTWAGVERLLRDPTIPADIPFARMVDPVMSEAMAETALWAVLGLHRGYFDYAEDQRMARWSPREQKRADEVRVAVLGLGEIGRSVARRLAQQGYRVSGWSARPAAIDGVETHHGAPALDGVLGSGDIVVNLLPLTDTTRGLFNLRTFERMPPGASLVNLARGAHVVDADLLVALQSGRIHRAVLDVFHVEPLPPEHVFWSHPRITVLPHVAAATDPRSAAKVVADNVRRVRQGLPPLHLVDRARGY